MEFKKCNRCGSFYVAQGDVCPKCNTKDTFELTTFKNYIEENGTDNTIDAISIELGISTRHLNRYLGYEGFEKYAKEFRNKTEEL